MGISLSTFVRAAKLKATAGGTSLRTVLEAILLGQFNASVVNGRTAIATSAGTMQSDRSCWLDLLPQELRRSVVTGLGSARASFTPRLAEESAAPSLPSQLDGSGSEAGGSVQFEIPDGLGPAQVIELAGEALDWLDSLPAEEQANPTPPRRVRRLRVCFSRAQV